MNNNKTSPETTTSKNWFFHHFISWPKHHHHHQQHHLPSCGRINNGGARRRRRRVKRNTQGDNGSSSMILVVRFDIDATQTYSNHNNISLEDYDYDKETNDGEELNKYNRSIVSPCDDKQQDEMEHSQLQQPRDYPNNDGEYFIDNKTHARLLETHPAAKGGDDDDDDKNNDDGNAKNGDDEHNHIKDSGGGDSDAVAPSISNNNHTDCKINPKEKDDYRRYQHNQRGLEYTVPEVRIKRRKNIFHARSVVFDNQNRCDPTRLAKLYHNQTKAVEREARRVGISDAKSVGMDPWPNVSTTMAIPGFHHHHHHQGSI